MSQLYYSRIIKFLWLPKIIKPPLMRFCERPHQRAAEVCVFFKIFADNTHTHTRLSAWVICWKKWPRDPNPGPRAGPLQGGLPRGMWVRLLKPQRCEKTASRDQPGWASEPQEKLHLADLFLPQNGIFLIMAVCLSDSCVLTFDELLLLE